MDALSITAAITGLCAVLALPFLLWGRWLGSAGTPNHDVDALIELYQQTGGTEWVKNENWCDLQKPIGDWYGVKVNSAGRVHKLILPRNKLRGALPACISRLDHLDELDLRENNLTGEIPKELGSMYRMEGLYLYGNHFSGEIPRELLFMSSVMGVYLYNNNFTGVDSAREWLKEGLPKDCLLYL